MIIPPEDGKKLIFLNASLLHHRLRHLFKAGDVRAHGIVAGFAVRVRGPGDLTFTDKKEQSLAIIIVARLFRSQSRKASVVL